MDLPARILLLADHLAETALPEVIERTRTEVGYGEYALAVEALCDNLYEHDTPLTPDQLTEIAGVATDLGLAEGTWDFLEDLVVTPPS